MATLLPGFKYLGGTARRYLNTATGEILSRRKYDETVRGRMSYEAIAKANKEKDELAQLARPARKRSSIQKLAPEIKAEIAKARQEDKRAREKLEKQLKEELKLNRLIERKKNKKVRTPKFSPRLLRPGTLSRRIPFSEYSQLVELFNGAKKSKVVFGYMVGIAGVDSRTGKELDAMLMPALRGLDRVISEGDFDDSVEIFLNEKLYFIPLHFFVHFSFTREYAKKVAQKAGIVWKGR